MARSLTRGAVALLIAGILVLTGCTARTPASPPGVPSTQSALIPYEQWRPPTPVTGLKTFTDAERQMVWEQRYQSARDDAKKEGAELARPAIVRWTDRDSSVRAWVECLQKVGWQARYAEGGGVLWPQVPADQQSAMTLAMSTCQLEYPLDPRYEQEQTKEQLGVYYDYYVQWLVPCLAKQGFSDVGTVPSREAWIADAPGGWDPSLPAVRAVGDGDSDAGAALQRACPRRPPMSALYP